MRELFLAATAGLLVLPAAAQQMDHYSAEHDHGNMAAAAVEPSELFRIGRRMHSTGFCVPCTVSAS